ncbi:putative receptor-like protein kinase [Cardamine amara subsp. amara]|uniref:Receptor-like protein kinase n=1 Tax=Cardamine amara subsp. amara TaxID=228776 RepID=A0ABD1C0W4_CARAN
MICYVLLVFSILVSLMGRGEGATAAYEPTDVFLFNCGAASDNVDENGRNWTVENLKFMPSNSVKDSISLDALYQESGVPQVPYMNARIFRSNFTYSFSVSPGWKFLRLYFYPTRYGSEFYSVNYFFSVTVNNFTLLRNFSAHFTVNASIQESKYLIKEYIIPVNQMLNLTFTPSLNSLAFVNGIEIVSMPDRFYSKGGFENMITNVGSMVESEIDNSTAFETVHRRNIGGRLVSDVRDSGMFRRWFPDDEDEIEGVVVSFPNAKINYTDKTPAYVAPEDVYATSRSMGNLNNDPRLNLQRNMTWYFTVDAGYTYLVRLHFYETMLEVNGTNQRIFSIYLGNQMAKQVMDLFWLSGGTRNPMFLDFRVDVGFANRTKSNIQLDLHPLALTGAWFNDVLLNGLEILKLSNTDGNLAGSPDLTPNPVTQPIKKGKKSHVLVIILILVGSTIGLASFIVVLMLSMRQMKRKKKMKENSVVMFKVLLKQYSYAELKKITKSFSHIVGKGGLIDT